MDSYERFADAIETTPDFDGKPLGGAPIAEWLQFWLDLQEFVALVHKRYVDPKVAFYLNGVGMTSDADQLAQRLRESTYFQAAIGDGRVARIVGDLAFASKFHEA